MVITIDRAGRVMLPKAFRERHGLTEGTKLDVTEEGAALLLTPCPAPIEIVELEGRLVAVGGAPITDETVQAILDEIRR